jgi:hypothetical protein
VKIIGRDRKLCPSNCDANANPFTAEVRRLSSGFPLPSLALSNCRAVAQLAYCLAAIRYVALRRISVQRAILLRRHTLSVSTIAMKEGCGMRIT